MLQERLEAAAAARFERAFNHSSKRFAKDERVVSAAAAGRLPCTDSCSLSGFADAQIPKHSCMDRYDVPSKVQRR